MRKAHFDAGLPNYREHHARAAAGVRAKRWRFRLDFVNLLPAVPGEAGGRVLPRALLPSSRAHAAVANRLRARQAFGFARSCAAFDGRRDL